MNDDDETTKEPIETMQAEEPEAARLQRELDQAHMAIGRLLMAQPRSELAKWITELRREFVA